MVGTMYVLAIIIASQKMMVDEMIHPIFWDTISDSNLY